ncbi:hypothetical protein KIW84_074624 [Lathyrus oleraceus]|uniref:DUF7745 domain-containing protein n=1 Tax=Pisum sativum TaxID=3888 RepID=A0A9D4VRR7_PEA|nr:hypothetical protein KIW84_074624 [Pisum sativum]
MDYGRRNTKKYSFRCPDLKELRKLAYFVLDPLYFKQHHGKLLSILSADVLEGLLSVLVQFYDPLYRCFTFLDFMLVPTLEEYSHLLGIPVYTRVPFSGLEEIPQSSIIAEALHLKKSEIETHWVKKGGLFGLPSDFLINEATAFAEVVSVNSFEAIFVFIIYGLALFPNIDGFVAVNAIILFLIGNLVPNLLGDMYFSLHLRNSKGGGMLFCCIPLLYNLEIIDSCGKFSNVPLIGTQGGINYNPVLARRQLGFPLRDKPNNTLKGRSELGSRNCVALEAYTLWVKMRALELKMPYPCERPMSMVVVETLTLPNQDVEELEDTLVKMKQEKDMWEERFRALSKKHEELQLDSKDKDALIELLKNRVTKRQIVDTVIPSSMPQPFVAWKKIVDQLFLEKTQIVDTVIPSDIVVRDP